MQKIFKLSFFLLFLLVFYIIFSSILKKYDSTPKWGNISIPEVAFPGKNLIFTINYKNINLPSQLFISLVYHNQNKRYLGQKNYTDSIPIICGTGKKQISLTFNPPDSVHKVMVNISRYTLPEKQNVSIYQCKRIGYPLRSEWILVSKDGSTPKNITLSYFDILKKGYQEGYWIQNRGDQTVIGWFITLLYFVVFIVSLYFSIKATHYLSNYRYIWFWYGVTALIFLFGINKQLDFQMLLTDFAREFVKVKGMYVNRKPFQIQIISIFTSIGIGILTFILYTLRFAPKRMWLALVGIGILFSFTIIRLISLHSIESFVLKSLLGIKIVDALEISGISIILFSVILNYFSCKNTTI